MRATIDVGSRVGRYEIVDLIGAGGMGRVYRAFDPLLSRHVALKVINSPAITDAQRARFEQEMRAIARIAHAHVLGVHDSGISDGVPFLVTELLSGDTLASRLRAERLPVRKALQYAAQILGGLEAAHRAGVIHLDLKPANVAITAQGDVKILDFGIARLIDTREDQPQSDETLTASAQGVAGSSGYMAPEQLSGDPIDCRADIFAIGLLLYEMLTGTPAFHRPTRSDTARAILTEDVPDLAARSDVPTAIVSVLRRCVEKRPDERFQNAHDVRLALDVATQAPATVRRTTRRTARALAVAGALVLAIAGALAAYGYTRTSATGAPSPLRLSVLAPEGTTASLGNAISHDGTMIAMVAIDRSGVGRLWIHSLDDASARPMDATEGATYPFWSPDDRQVAFFSNGKLRAVPVGGGAVHEIGDAPAGRGGSWVGDTILFTPATETGLQTIRASTGSMANLTALDAAQSELSHRFPSFSPDGRHFTYFTMSRGSGTAGWVMVAPAASPQQARRVIDSNVAAVWAPDGSLLYVRNGALWAQQIDPETGSLIGNPTAVAPSVQLARFFGYPTFSVSRAGVLAYQANLTGSAELVWRDRSGTVVEGTGFNGEFMGFTLAPHQRAIAATLRHPQTGRLRLHIYDLERRVLTPMGPDDAASRVGAWSPDAAQIAFTSNQQGRNDVFVSRLAEPGKSELVVKLDAFDANAESWSADNTLIFSATSATGWGTWKTQVAGTASPEPVSLSRTSRFDARLSPSGRWLTVTSEETGRREVWAQSYPTATTRTQISASGGQAARWRGDGRELYFVNARRELMAVDVDENTGRFGLPKRLFETYPADAGGNPVLYDVTSDGQRFLIVQPRPGAQVPATTVLINWTSLIAR